jgi:hypothetical protein
LSKFFNLSSFKVLERKMFNLSSVNILENSYICGLYEYAKLERVTVYIKCFRYMETFLRQSRIL